MFRHLATLILCFASFAVWAESDCDAVLVQRNVTNVEENSYYRMAWMQLIDRENYEEVKRDADASIADWFSGSYEDFAKKRASFKSESRFELTTDTSRSLMQSLLDSGAVSAWESCMTSRGFYHRVGRITPTEVQLVLYFDPPAGINTIKSLSTDLPAFVKSASLRNTKKMGRGKKTFVLRRSKNLDFMAAITGLAGTDGEYGTTFFIPAAFKLGPDQPLGKAPVVRASGAGECDASLTYATGNARREIRLEGTATALSGGYGTVGVNILVNGKQTCGESFNGSINMGANARCDSVWLDANSIHRIQALQFNRNATCKTTMVRLIH